MFDGSGVPGPAEERAHGENLVEGQFAVEGVAAGQAVGGFEVDGRERLDCQDFWDEVGRVLADGLNDGVAEGVAILLPVAGFQLVGGELHVDGHDVLACWGQGVVLNGGNGNVEIGGGGKFAVFGVIEGALEVVDAGADVNASGERGGGIGGAGIFQRGEIRERVEGNI